MQPCGDEGCQSRILASASHAAEMLRRNQILSTVPFQRSYAGMLKDLSGAEERVAVSFGTLGHGEASSQDGEAGPDRMPFETDDLIEGVIRSFGRVAGPSSAAGEKCGGEDEGASDYSQDGSFGSWTPEAILGFDARSSGKEQAEVRQERGAKRPRKEMSPEERKAEREKNNRLLASLANRRKKEWFETHPVLVRDLRNELPKLDAYLQRLRELNSFYRLMLMNGDAEQEKTKAKEEAKMS